MKVLIVCSKTNGKIAPFITEQVESLQPFNLSFDYFFIENKGIKGYLQAFFALKQTIKKGEPTLIHAHYGLSGLLANLQRRIPVVTTYHGSDINNPKVKCFSKIAIRLSQYNIFVSEQLALKIRYRSCFLVIPCGVNLSLFYPVEKQLARQALGWDTRAKYILFAGNPEDKVKNFTLAQQATETLENVYLIPLVNYRREEVNLLMNAADVALMTSITEGSPQFIKEAMACNCPIVSTDVGDVNNLISTTDGCFITSFDKEAVVHSIKAALDFSSTGKRTDGRLKIQGQGIDLATVASRINAIYQLFAQ
ncbi:glycosyltransferase [Microbacter margulisiae]|uniref:Glycosyltransferase involved in cell wall biosynthesis n=1 Tax=Microbacter margulisiae TaxID=1350067 RepID=A0A7W5DS25_9PORP|nr:glycosyltransferase [Microbacter margulisiae]MBB3188024.1 glycosyltransferase involved in cell wall biosynthesis [Microbacter margulisiae]